jgi:hypothetical protein
MATHCVLQKAGALMQLVKTTTADAPTETTYRVVARVSPFSERTVAFDLTPDHTVADAAARLGFAEGMTYQAWIFDQPLDQSKAHRIRPNAGTTLYIKPTLHAPAALLAPLIASATGLAVTSTAVTVLSSLASALISTALSFISSLLLAPKAPEIARNPDEPTVYNLSGARNSAQPFGVIPSVLGKARFVPPYAGLPYTEIVDNDQYLRLLVVWSYGTCQITDLKIGETLIDDYKDIEYEHVLNDGGATAVTLYPDQVRQEDLSIVFDQDDAGNYSTWQKRTTPIETDEIGITVTWPQGLARYTSSGKRVDFTTHVQAEYSVAEAEAWTSFVDEDVVAHTAQPLRRSWRTTVSRNEYDVRVRYRYVISAALEDPDKVRADATWTALRSFKNEDPIQLDGLSYTAIRVRATDQLNGVLDQINAIVERRIPVYSGGNWFTTGYSRNPADIYRYILTADENKRALGISSIDDDALATWWQFCADNKFTYGHVIDFDISIWDLLVQIASAGRATPSVVDSKWGVIIDTYRPTVVQHFTPRNTWNYSGQRLWPEQPHGFRVRFINQDRDYITDEMTDYDDGYDASNASIFEALELPGVQGSDQAYVIARQFLAITRLRPEIHTFEVDIENLIATRGDRVVLNHDVPLIGTGYGRVAGVSGQVITLDQTITMESGTNYCIRFRLADNTTLCRTVVLTVGDYNTITLSASDATSDVPSVGDLFMFGPVDAEVLDLIIHSIRPGSDMTATIECYPYSPEIFDAATSIPAFDSKVSIVHTRSMKGPANPEITDVVLDERALTRTALGDILPGINVFFRRGVSDPAANGRQYTLAENFRVRWHESGSEDGYSYSPLLQDTGSYLIQGVENGESYDIEVQAYDKFGASSSWALALNQTVMGTTAAPTTLTSFVINTTGDQTYAIWSYDDIPADVIAYEIRYHADQDVTSWAAMTPIASNIPRDARSYAVPSRHGTYAIKAIDVNGTRSETALYSNVGLSDPRAYYTAATNTDALTGGTYTDTVLNGSHIQLDVDANGDFKQIGYYEFASATDLGMVTSVKLISNIGSDILNPDNLMSVWTTLAAVTTLSGSISPNDVQVTMQVAISTVASGTPSYGAWQQFVVGEYTAKHLKFRAVLETRDVGFTPILSAASVVMQLEDLIVSEANLTSGTSAYNVTFAPKFHTLKSITILPQNMATGDYYTISSKSRSGFTVTFYDSSSSEKNLTFDYQAYGYGREKA